MAGKFTFDIRSRLISTLILTLFLGAILFARQNKPAVTPLPAHPTTTSSTTNAKTVPPPASPSSVPTPQPAPIEEIAYRTSGGLRYADRDAYQRNLNAASTMSDATNVLNGFFARYGIVLTTTTDSLPTTSQSYTTYNLLSPTDKTDLIDTKKFGSLLIDEWSKYPVEWVKTSYAQKIALVKNLAYHGKPDWGEASPEAIIFYQVTPYDSLGPLGEDYLRRIIHHEFDHEIEFLVRGGMEFPDPTWASFNPDGFTYGKTLPYSEHPGPGFVTGYSEYSIGEDKADLYSYLFVNADGKKLANWQTTDPILSKKVAYYKSFIKKLVPVMDDHYFSSINP